MLTIIGDYFVFSGALLVLFQINIGLAYDRRKETADFIARLSTLSNWPNADSIASEETVGCEKSSVAQTFSKVRLATGNGAGH